MKFEVSGLTLTATWERPRWFLRLCRRPHAWTLMDLQVCIDELDFRGVTIDQLRCNHATRRHLLRLMEGRWPRLPYLRDTIPIEAEREMANDIFLARKAGTARVFFVYPLSRRVGNSA